MLFRRIGLVDGMDASASSGGWRVLIVDDELPALEGARAAVDWRALGVAAVETAMNIRRAKEALGRGRVDLMLCDIEMPQGSGLELLEWARAEHPETECVFLTCHAEFGYAKEAIRLGGLDYLLKPIAYADLGRAIGRALEKVAARRVAQADSADARQWRGSARLVKERFWQELAESQLGPSEEAIAEAAGSYGLAADDLSPTFLALGAIRRWHFEYAERDRAMLSWAVRRAGEDLFSKEAQAISASLADNSFLLAASASPGGEGPLEAALRRRCREWIAFASERLHCELSCYLLGWTPLSGVAPAVARFRHMESRNVSSNARLFDLGPRETEGRPAGPAPTKAAPMPDTRTWAPMISSGRAERLAEELAALLSRSAAEGRLDIGLLTRIHHDLLQAMYSALEASGVPAHEVLEDEESISLSSRATRSTSDFLAWARFALRRAQAASVPLDSGATAIERAKRFVERNLSRDLSRDEIAAEAGVHPDYLNRLFKRDSGDSVMDWVASRRLELARELLARTDLPIGEVAAQVGYTNFSYFSAVFRKKYLANPSDYRRSSRSE
jgi:Response regulator containing CheY-like receiver domain and AraC-type DNA-binding domain